MKTKLPAFALTIALLSCFGGAGLADARPAAHSGISHSFKGGFSSQRSAMAGGSRAATPAPAGARPQFGSFGSARPAVPAPQKSALARSLDQKAASDNALRTLDARRAASAPAAAAPAAPPAPNQHGSPAQLPQPVVVQQRGGVGDVLMGFMLGRAMNGGHAAAPSPASGAVPVDGSAGSSFGASFLRTFLWLLVLGAIGWAVWFALRRARRLKQERTPNYAFERN